MAPIILTEKDKARFFSKLERDEATGCLEWTAGIQSKGYGVIRVGSRLLYAHHVAFALGGGVLAPDRPFVLHNCPCGDNRRCCEFTHLWAGSPADNSLDMARKGRGRRGALPYGVSRVGKRFRADIQLLGRHHCLGSFDSAEQAGAAALEEKLRLLEVSAAHRAF